MVDCSVELKGRMLALYPEAQMADPMAASKEALMVEMKED
jgi:hypothetical protein